MKCNKTYSLNVRVVEEFEREMGDANKSELLEALMIKFLIDYSRGGRVPRGGRVKTDSSSLGKRSVAT